jgi:hypothetical protein
MKSNFVFDTNYFTQEAILKAKDDTLDLWGKV